MTDGAIGRGPLEYRYAPIDNRSVEGLGAGEYGAALRFVDRTPKDWLLAWPEEEDAKSPPTLYALEEESGGWRVASNELLLAEIKTACEEANAAAEAAWYEEGVMTLAGLLREEYSDEPGPKGGASERAKADVALGERLASIRAAVRAQNINSLRTSVYVIALDRRRADMPRLRECSIADLDAARYIGARNGVIDLHAEPGEELLPPDSETAKLAFVTASLPDAYVPGAVHPDTDRLLAGMKDADALKYAWDLMGCALQGEPRDELVLIVSEANSGKTTFANAMQASLGRYAGVLAGSALVEKSQRNPALDDLMPPRRYAFLSEVQQYRLSEGALKRATGGETIAYRHLWTNQMRRKKPSATMVISGNGMPAAELGMNSHDGGMKRRIRALPFSAIPKAERMADASAMLGAWRLEGGEAAKHRRQALVARLVRSAMEQGETRPEPPQSVIDEVERLAQMDGREAVLWMKEAVETGADRFLPAETLWYAALAGAGEDHGAKRAFNETRQSITAIFRRVTGAPKSKPESRPESANKVVRGWRGYGLTEKAEAELRAWQEGDALRGMPAADEGRV